MAPKTTPNQQEVSYTTIAIGILVIIAAIGYLLYTFDLLSASLIERGWAIVFIVPAIQFVQYVRESLQAGKRRNAAYFAISIVAFLMLMVAFLIPLSAEQMFPLYMILGGLYILASVFVR